MTPPSITERQKEILSLLALGKSNKEISHALKIKEGTVKQHLFTLFRKLGVTSRHKAALVAADLLRQKEDSQNQDSMGASYLKELPKEYAWRLVTVVAIRFDGENNTADSSQRSEHERISVMFKRAQALAAILQGAINFIPDREIIATFGAPRPHLDDASRALIFARLLCRFIQDRLNFSCNIGIATTTTLVSFDDEALYRSDAYNLARDLSVFAMPGQILATDLTCKMAGSLFTYRKYESQTERTGFIIKEVAWQETASSGQSSPRIQLPFFNELIAKAHTRKTQWVRIKGWPPSVCIQLLDIFSQHGKNRNLRVGNIRMPTGLSPISTIKNLHHQLYLFGLIRASEAGEKALSDIDGDGHRFIDALVKACQGDAIRLLLLYGTNSRDKFLNLTKNVDLTALSNLPLIIVTTGEIAQASPELVVELLENHPTPTGTHLSYHLKLPESLFVPDGLARDLATLLEMLTPQARQAIYRYTNERLAAISVGSNANGIEIGKELLVSGLFRLDNGQIVCRDPATQKALTRFFATR